MLRRAAIIYSRCGSSRYPQKCFAELGPCKTPMIKWLLLRASLLNVDVIILATTTRDGDKPLVEFVRSLKMDRVEVVCGAETNLVERTITCLDAQAIGAFARINGDSPFFPVSEINSAFDAISANPANKFVTNLLTRSYPYGVAVEVLSAQYYKEHSASVPEHEREHTTQHLYHPAPSDTVSVKLNESLANVKLTVDTVLDHCALNDLILDKGLDPYSEWTEAL